MKTSPNRWIIAIGAMAAVASIGLAAPTYADSSSSSSSNSSGTGQECYSEIVVNGEVVASSTDCDAALFSETAAPETDSAVAGDSSNSSSQDSSSDSSSQGTDSSESTSSAEISGDGTVCYTERVVNGVVESNTDCEAVDIPGVNIPEINVPEVNVPDAGSLSGFAPFAF
jgi:hypothetical protein